MLRLILGVLALHAGLAPALAATVRCTFPEKGIFAGRELAFDADPDGTFTEIGSILPKRLWRLVAVRTADLVVASTFGEHVVLVSRTTVEADGRQQAPARLAWGATTVDGGRCHYAGPPDWAFLKELR